MKPSTSSSLQSPAYTRSIDTYSSARHISTSMATKTCESGSTATLPPLFFSPLARLPRVKCPRASVGGSPRKNPHLSPRTPRRRSGRLAAGAALTFFNTFGPPSPTFSSLMISPRSIQQMHTYLTPTAALSSGGAASSSITPPSSPILGRTLSDSGNHRNPFTLSPNSTPLVPRNDRQALASVCKNAIVAAAIPAGKGGDAGEVKAGASASAATVGDAKLEHSLMANEELLLFFYQMDLNMRLQRALNQDQYEPAQQLREKIAEVDLEIARQREVKMGTSSKDEAQDKGLAILRLKAELQRAVEAEQYEVAAGIRKQMSKLETDTLAASAAALAMRNVKYEFRLGQKLLHNKLGYKCVVAGMDPVCCETDEWMTALGIQDLTRGQSQPFYQVLLDLSGGATFPVAYVAEELLTAPEEPDLSRFDHPYTYLLFYGIDGAGDFIPCKQLRDKYNAARHEVSEDDEEAGGSSGLPKGNDSA